MHDLSFKISIPTSLAKEVAATNSTKDIFG
jgi:hypothetical protein